MTENTVLDPEWFRTHLNEKLKAAASDEELDALDDLIHSHLGQGNLEQVAESAHIAVELLSADSRPWPLAYALNTLVLVHAERGDVAKMREALKILIDHSIEFGTPSAGLSGIDNVKTRLGGMAPPDYLMHILSDMVRFYLHFGGIEPAIDTILAIAALLSDYGAFQPAYNALGDAEELARKHKMPIHLARILSTESMVALVEGDREFGMKAGKLALDLYKELDEPPPAQLLLNLATAAMKAGDHIGATSTYRDYIHNTHAKPSSTLAAAFINMSICQRKLEKQEDADASILLARNILNNLPAIDIDPEQLIELELVATANALAASRLNEMAARLADAVHQLNRALSVVDKLHYRRALRERYIARIEHFLCVFPAVGEVSKVCRIIASTRSNQLSDWLHLLDWVDDLCPLMRDADQEALRKAIDRLTNFGAPFLQGYREKYNDPLNAGMMPDPWREFSELAIGLSKQYGFRSALATACLPNAEALIDARLKQGYAVLVAMTENQKALLMIEGRYQFCEFPHDISEDFLIALAQHREKTISTQAFARIITQYQNSLLANFENIIKELNGSTCCGLIFMPDRWDILPIHLISMGAISLRERMSKGEFEVKTCIALYPEKTAPAGVSSPLALVEEPTDLKYATTQVSVFDSVLGASGKLLTNAKFSDIEASMISADALLIAHHGVSVGLYNDPSFANLGGLEHKGGIYFDQLQESAHKWNHRLAMLAACHSGGLISRNAQRDFKSHEMAGYPSILLLNRRCVVTSAAWATIDRFDFFLSTRFALAIKDSSTISKSFNIALASLVNMSASDVISLFDHVSDFELREQMKKDAKPTSIEQMKVAPFCYGAYQLYSLF